MAQVRFIKRHSLLTRITHCTVAVACVWLMISGLFVFVPALAGIDGRQREQYCSMCGTVWPFDRMRCGVCGVDNPTRLHYFHVEGDESHRLQNCDECGQCQRVLFEDDLAIPVSFEVEDVVMAKLDKIALDPRFRA